MLEFNELMLFPDGIKEWSSKNRGADEFLIEYTPSKSTEAYLYENDIDAEMSWYLSEVDPKYIKINIEFNYPTAISTNPLD